MGSGGRRDSVARRPRPQGRSVSEPRDPPPQPGLGDSLESIPSLSQSPEPGRHSDTVPPVERPLEDLRLRLDQLGWAARGAGSGEDSATSSSTPLENEEPDGLEASEPEGEVSEGVWLTRMLPRRKLMAFSLCDTRGEPRTPTCAVSTFATRGSDSSS